MEMTDGHFRWLANERLVQTAARLLARMAKEPKRLVILLNACGIHDVPETDLSDFSQRIRRVYWGAVWAKALNGLLFLVTLLICFLGVLWPAIVDQLHIRSDLFEDFSQALVFIVAGGLLVAYQIRKSRQTKSEDVLRQSLFVVEPMEGKLHRLREFSETNTDGEKKGVGPRNLSWSFASKEELADRLGSGSDGILSKSQLLVIAAQLKDGAIKDLSYRIVAHVMRIAAVVAIGCGLSLPLYISELAEVMNPESVGTTQSLLVLGAGGLALGIRRSYLTKRSSLLHARARVFMRGQSFVQRTQHLPSALYWIDQGLENSGG